MSQILYNSIKIGLIALYPPLGFPKIGESQGVCAISGYLLNKYKDVSVDIYDQQIISMQDIINEICIKQPIIIGVSLKVYTMPQFHILYDLIVKHIYPIYKPIIILGNSIPHFNGENLLYKYNEVVIALGEGEVSFGDFYEYIKGKRQLNNIRNIMYLENSQIIRNEFKYLDKNNIPFADRRYSLIYYNAGNEVYIEGSRGCAYCACNICECKYFLGSTDNNYKWRDRPIKSIVNELAYLSAIGVDSVTFSDEDFIGPTNYGLRRVVELTNLIVEKSIKIKFRINIRVKSICSYNDSDEIRNLKIVVLQKLKKAGLVKIFLGFESGSQTQIHRYGKGFLLNEFLSAKKILNDLQIDFELGFIPIDPLVSIEELRESLLFIKKNNCICNISTIYKELRIQQGNLAYRKLIQNCEINNKLAILGALDTNTQRYNIVNYKDPIIAKIVSGMTNYSRETYELYYLMRILTQYAKDIDDYICMNIYNCMEDLKNNDFELLMILAETTKDDNDTVQIRLIIEQHSEKRDNIYAKLFKIIKSNSNEKYMYLCDLMKAVENGA